MPKHENGKHDTKDAGADNVGVKVGSIPSADSTKNKYTNVDIDHLTVEVVPNKGEIVTITNGLRVRLNTDISKANHGAMASLIPKG